MTGYAVPMGVLGLGAGAGLAMVLHALHGTSTVRDPKGKRLRRLLFHFEYPGRWLTAAGAAGLLVGVTTGWVVGGLLAAMATWTLPRLLGSSTANRQHVARIEGIASWTEMLRDTLAAAAGLEQAVMATAHTSPIAVRPQIQGLAVRLASGCRLGTSLRRLADDLSDPTADLVIAALILASEYQARQLAPLLGELAATARGQVEMRQRVEASRARTRTTMRVVVITTLTFAAGLILLNPAFLAPYDTVTGQLVLLLIGGVFTVAFAWLRRMSRIEQPERFLTEPGFVGRAPDAIGAVSPEASL